MPTIKSTYDIHPAAEVFPPMGEEDYKEFKADIKENGLAEPIALYKGQLLDGRNRLRACQELGIEPETQEISERRDPFKYVSSKNLHRRRLSDSQRALCGARLAKIPRGGDRSKLSTEVSIEKASELMDVSHASISRARQVLKGGSKDLVKAVENDQVAVSAAAKLVEQVPDKRAQSKLVRSGAQAIRKVLGKNGKRPPPSQTKKKDNPISDVVKEFDALWARASKAEQTTIRARVLSEGE